MDQPRKVSFILSRANSLDVQPTQRLFNCTAEPPVLPFPMDRLIAIKIALVLSASARHTPTRNSLLFVLLPIAKTPIPRLLGQVLNAFLIGLITNCDSLVLDNVVSSILQFG